MHLEQLFPGTIVTWDPVSFWLTVWRISHDQESKVDGWISNGCDSPVRSCIVGAVYGNDNPSLLLICIERSNTVKTEKG